MAENRSFEVKQKIPKYATILTKLRTHIATIVTKLWTDVAPECDAGFFWKFTN